MPMEVVPAVSAALDALEGQRQEDDDTDDDTAVLLKAALLGSLFMKLELHAHETPMLARYAGLAHGVQVRCSVTYKTRINAHHHAQLPPGGVQGWRASTRPAGLPHPWGAMSCRKAAPLTYFVLVAPPPLASPLLWQPHQPRPANPKPSSRQLSQVHLV